MDVAIIELNRDGAALKVHNHCYPLTWDDQHPDPRPEAERILAQYEDICHCQWQTLTPLGWDTQIPEAQEPGPGTRRQEQLEEHGLD